MSNTFHTPYTFTTTSAMREQHFVRPAARGSWQCFCRGEVVMMRGNYGWLAAYADIDHPDADKHEGHVYIHMRDVKTKGELFAGDLVTFYLYADKDGLGAEYCCLEETEQTPYGFEASPPPYSMQWPQPDVPFRADAPTFQPLSDRHAPVGSHAPVGTPSWFGGDAPLAVPNKISLWNAMGVSDDESEGHSSTENGEVVWDAKSRAMMMIAPSRQKEFSRMRCSSRDTAHSSSSTGDGNSSDSDWDYQVPMSMPVFRPPPGLSLPA